MKTKLLFFILISLILVSCSTQRSLNKNTNAESDCVVPKENTLKYKSQKAYSTMRYRVRMNKNNSYANRSRTGRIHPQVDAPLLLASEEQSINEIQSGLNEIKENWNALEASWNDLKDSWDDPQLRDIDLQDMFSHTRSEPGEERQAGTHFTSTDSKDLAEPELQNLDLIPARYVPGMTNTDDEAKLIVDYQNEMEMAAKRMKRGDRLLYLGSALMGLFSFGLFRGFRKKVNSFARWSKANVGKAQALIAGSQTLLMGLAIYSGHNLRELGFEISPTPSYIFAGLMAAGLLSSPFLPSRDTIAIPRQVNLQRLKYLGIVLSSVMILATYGNNVVSNHPDSTVATVLTSMDNAFIQTQADTSMEDKQPEPKKYRWGVLFLTLLATVAAVVGLCAGICIAALVGTAAGVIGGIALIGLSIAVFIVSNKWFRKRFKIAT